MGVDIAAVNVSNREPDIIAKMRLDSHAVSPVVGYNAYVWRDTGKTISVGGFSKALGRMSSVPIVDAMVTYECPYTNQSYLLVIHNALYVPENEDCYIAPFLMREAGLLVSDKAKQHCTEPTVEDHAVYVPAEELRISLAITGVVSYFSVRKPTESELQELPHIDLTPGLPSWDPYDVKYERREDVMLDFQGNIIPAEERLTLLDSDSDDNMYAELDDVDFGVTIDAVFQDVCDSMPYVLGDDEYDSLEHEIWDNTIAAINPALDPHEMANAMNERLCFSKLGMSVGSMVADPGFVVGATHQDKPKGISPERLAKVFRIDDQTARRTLQVTTQRVKRVRDPTLNRNFSNNDRVLRYRYISTHFFTDTMFASKRIGPSFRGNKCMQLFVTDKGYLKVIPMKDKGQVPKAYRLFFKHVGVPDAIVCDGSREQTMGEAKKVCDSVGTSIRVLERNKPFSNRAELYIGIVKRAIKRDLRESDAPMRFWDYCAERIEKVNNATAKNLFQLEGQTAHYHITGQQPDISNISQFAWYEWVYGRDVSRRFPDQSLVLGRALGPATNVGSEMSQWVVVRSGDVVPFATIRPLTDAEKRCPIEQRKRSEFDQAVRLRHGDSINSVEGDEDVQDNEIGETMDPYEDDEEAPRNIPDADDNAYDNYVSAELQLANGDRMERAKVLRRHRNADGDTIGTRDDNPVLDTRVYDVEFSDGSIKQYAANIIAENMYSQVDSDGYHIMLLDEIIDHRKNGHAVDKADKYLNTKRGRKLRKSTIGWDMRVLWRDGSTSWIPLKQLKESNPVEIAEYAVANGIDDECAFQWWVPFTLRKRDMIIAAVNNRVRHTLYKYGHKIPKTVKEAFALDKENGNDRWRKAIEKEMGNVMIAFTILEDSEGTPVGYSLAKVHMVFDVKMDGTFKARLCKDGHLTEDPEGSRYAGVVSRESVRIALLYAALNDIEVMAADIRNAYLQAATSEKHYIICGPEFGIENQGKRALITRALYGGKVSGRDYRNSLRSCMKHIGFESCLADPDVWMRTAKKPDGSDYWEYVLLYTDDALCISCNAEQVLRDEIGKYFTMKEESIGIPDLYLGGRITKVTLENGVSAWGFSSSQYVQQSVKNVEEHLMRDNKKLPARASTPLSPNYRPELDISPELAPEEAAYFQSLIGVLRWIVELGRVDICLEVSMLASHLAMPRQGHMNEVLHIFAYLKKNHNAEMVFDPSDPDIDPNEFQRRDWEATEFGDDLEEILPENKPKPLGLGIIMRAYVDADHAAEVVTRRSRTGFLVYLNNAPIYWSSKKQNSVETSSFGSEFMAMKHCTEYVRGLRYKLRMMGIPCELPTFIYGDNKSVLANTTVPDSTLKKKSNSIAYHFVREGCARDEWRTAYVNTHVNPADLLTKPLPSGEKRRRFVNMILYHLFGGGHA